jgi:hypothetical protein
MSTSNPEAKMELPRDTLKARSQLKVVQHSMLFYWWPVWAVGFILCLISVATGERMALVPRDSTIKRTGDKSYQIEVNVPPPANEDGTALDNNQAMPIKNASAPFGLRMAPQRYLGIIFMITLLLVIVSTNVPLRGLWSVVVLVVVALLILLISQIEGAWTSIFRWLGLLDIHINAGGYLFISTVLFAIWAVTMFWFDRQIYIVFTPGLMKVRETIGGGETAYDTSNMTIEHLRDDMFRHWILGLGSGDLVVHPAGPQSREIRLNNVLFVSSKLRSIEDFKATSRVTSSRVSAD